MGFIRAALDIFFHLDQHLNNWAGDLGSWLYAVLFAVIFCETGLVVTPLLPGDSLLFAVGALGSKPSSPINLPLAAVLMCAAAVAGDAVNYWAGFKLGPKVFTREDSRLLNRKHLLRARDFYERHGGKTIILARFIPIIRTFAPFVAGIGQMSYPRFALFNVTGGVLWVLSFLTAGYYFAGLPLVKEKFHFVILAIIVISVLPAVFEYWRASRRERAKERVGAVAPRVGK